MLWEVHKAYIRGILIEMGARKKSERREKKQKLRVELARAEEEHKKQRDQHSQEIYQKVVNKKTELKMVMEQESRIMFNKIARERYQWGNKSSKLLARMVQKKNARNFIEKNSDQGGTHGIFFKEGGRHL